MMMEIAAFETIGPRHCGWSGGRGGALGARGGAWGVISCTGLVMRDRAAYSADRISGCVIVTTGLLSGVLLFVVALPLALSNPFPTPKQSTWIIQPSFQTATVAAAPPRPQP